MNTLFYGKFGFSLLFYLFLYYYNYYYYFFLEKSRIVVFFYFPPFFFFFFFFFFKKKKGLSHLHSEWVSEKRIEEDANGMKKLKNFMKKHPAVWDGRVDLFDSSYVEVDRLLAARPGPGYLEGDTRFEYLVKFTGLNYSHSRWEFPDDFADDNAIVAFQKRNMLPSHYLSSFSSSSSSSSPSSPSPPSLSPTSWKPMGEEENYFKGGNQLHPWQLEGVNWLLFNWYHHRGSILADEMGLGKTVQIVVTLNKIAQVCSNQPFLIVAPLGTIPHWQREFQTWTDLNPVVYQGNKEDRRVCHFFEFRYLDKVYLFIHLFIHSFIHLKQTNK
ncbi:myb domain-containing protein [Reticulomyxa filosa]|uniref:Myb domain-containing protein n=1 Tax=Reticulomyxa filosa TaxID=46433 RepID=X6M950_RETFI|nr:myb domain-containing protein [Reticulomyxa filosa]|eukprot:ETO10002.1 myb domain-containing protein [Reticulomyxa filosa]